MTLEIVLTFGSLLLVLLVGADGNSKKFASTKSQPGCKTCLLWMKGEQRSCEFGMNTGMMNGQKLDDRVGIFLKLQQDQSKGWSMNKPKFDRLKNVSCFDKSIIAYFQWPKFGTLIHRQQSSKRSQIIIQYFQTVYLFNKMSLYLNFYMSTCLVGLTGWFLDQNQCV